MTERDCRFIIFSVVLTCPFGYAQDSVCGETIKKFEKILIFFVKTIDDIRILFRIRMIRGQAEG
jgi:hypothetical protein